MNNYDSFDYHAPTTFQQIDKPREIAKTYRDCIVPAQASTGAKP